MFFNESLNPPTDQARTWPQIPPTPREHEAVRLDPPSRRKTGTAPIAELSATFPVFIVLGYTDEDIGIHGGVPALISTRNNNRAAYFLAPTLVPGVSVFAGAAGLPSELLGSGLDSAFVSRDVSWRPSTRGTSTGTARGRTSGGLTGG